VPYSSGGLEGWTINTWFLVLADGVEAAWLPPRLSTQTRFKNSGVMRCGALLFYLELAAYRGSLDIVSLGCLVTIMSILDYTMDSAMRFSISLRTYLHTETGIRTRTIKQYSTNTSYCCCYCFVGGIADMTIHLNTLKTLVFLTTCIYIYMLMTNDFGIYTDDWGHQGHILVNLSFYFNLDIILLLHYWGLVSNKSCCSCRMCGNTGRLVVYEEPQRKGAWECYNYGV
jgi:hypothetical protein